MPVKVRVLGCSGGIGGGASRTTAFLVGADTLIDAGTGVGELELDELRGIDHVFVTHSHLDHILGIPLIVDAVGGLRDRPLTVHALPATIDALRRHFFNWTIWPDFTAIPSVAEPGLRFEPMVPGQTVVVGDAVRIAALPAVHVVPAMGYQVETAAASLVFTGDTAPNPALWPIVNGIENLRHLVIECAFSEADRVLAQVSCHLCPSLLAAELAHLGMLKAAGLQIHVTHLKPGDSERTMSEIARFTSGISLNRLREGTVFEL